MRLSCLRLSVSEATKKNTKKTEKDAAKTMLGDKSYREKAKEVGLVDKHGEPLPGTLNRIVHGSRGTTIKTAKQIAGQSGAGRLVDKLVKVKPKPRED
jgi:hypothetical protein